MSAATARHPSANRVHGSWWDVRFSALRLLSRRGPRHNTRSLNSSRKIRRGRNRRRRRTGSQGMRVRVGSVVRGPSVRGRADVQFARSCAVVPVADPWRAWCVVRAVRRRPRRASGGTRYGRSAKSRCGRSAAHSGCARKRSWFIDIGKAEIIIPVFHNWSGGIEISP